MVISFNFFRSVAMACKACKIKYVSWVYDSPSVQLYSDAAKYDTSFIFHFDQFEVEKLQSLGVNNIYYLPLAADVDFYDGMKFSNLDETKKAHYTSDVAFVGSMYTEKKQSLYSHFDELDEYTKGYIDGIIKAQQMVYGLNFMEEAIDESLLEKLQSVAPMGINPGGFETLPWVYSDYFFARKLAAKERFEILKMISEDMINPVNNQKINVKLYTHEDTPELSNVNNMGPVDYYNHSPYVFKGSKINLNISLRSIRSGIPQRAMDIMGCGGFLLTNYQPDMMELFVPDEDFVYFENKDDLREKIAYYLAHEEERKQIALNGYRKVKEYHQLDQRLDEIWKVVG